MGGGTFDVSVIEIGGDVIEVLATNGDNHLGGDDFDERILTHLMGVIKDQYRVDIRKDPSAMQRLRESAEQCKKELSTAQSSRIYLPYLTMNKGEPLNFEYALTRQVFQDLIKDLVERTAIPVQNALNDAGIAASELDKVILVGGSTRIPAVQDKVRSLTGKVPERSINPDECVAQGAAMQGDLLTDGSLTVYNGGSGLLLLDVTPLSLSIETVGGVATRLVERNSTLPVHYSQVFTTAAAYQRSVDINVLQGERPMARDNKSIGRFRLSGIKAAPAGVPQIEVSFDIDVNGILTVSARDLDTGRAQSITIDDNERMSDAEIQRAIHDAQEYAAQDSIRSQAVESNNEAKRLLGQVQQAMQERRKELSKEDRNFLKNDISELEKAVSRNNPSKATDAELQAVKTGISNLQQSSGRILGIR